MDVFDSSVWLWGLLTDSPEPSRLIQEVLDGDRSVAVSAYIHDEVTTTLRTAPEVTGQTKAGVSDAQMTFNNTVADLDNVIFPDQDEIGTTYADEVRSRPEMRLLGTILEIQTKDAPVLVFAFDLDSESTLFVADSGFNPDLADNNIKNVKIEPVDMGG